MNEGKFTDKAKLLKDARLELLRLHKLLVDSERRTYEGRNGLITSGQFLQLLLSDENFSWLRKFSSLIVEIDEMLDINDGFSEEMINKQLSQIQNLLLFESTDTEFNSKYRNFVENNSDIREKHNELQEFIGKK